MRFPTGPYLEGIVAISENFAPSEKKITKNYLSRGAKFEQTGPFIVDKTKDSPFSDEEINHKSYSSKK